LYASVTHNYNIGSKAMHNCFAAGADIDYTKLIKLYGKPENARDTRYNPAECTSSKPQIIIGNPDMSKASTSYAERQHLTMRMCMRRFARLTNAFSRKLENHIYALALYFMHYDFARPHKTLAYPYPKTPAMASGLTDRV
jgi:hypothetical protein